MAPNFSSLRINYYLEPLENYPKGLYYSMKYFNVRDITDDMLDEED